MSSTKKFAFLALFLCCVFSLSIPAVRAQTITVTSTSDNGAGSLREALASVTDGDTIDASSVTGTITLATGELVVTNSVSILGPGPTNLAVDGGGSNRVFNIGNLGSVTISGLTITNGADAGDAGGVFNDQSALMLTNCVVAGNSASFGGAIYNNGFNGSATLIILNSRISGNSSANGGGIFNDGVGGLATITIRNSTLSDNSAGAGGGVHNQGAFSGTVILTIDTSTFSSNSASTGAGIYNDGVESGTATVMMTNSTFSGNSADVGGGIYNNANNTGTAILTITSSTFSDNSAVDDGAGVYLSGENSGDAELEIGSTILNAGASGENLFNLNNAGTITSDGYNLSSDSGGGVLTATGDQTNTPPLLGPLADNGGPTFTHALLCDSPAIDAIPTNANCVATDQRGVTRPQGPRCDIGAFELETNAPPVAVCADVTIFAGSDCTANASANDVDNGSTGDCKTLSVSPSGPYALGGTEVTLTVVDVHGLTNTCMATITVVDTNAPSITCPSNISTNTAPGACNSTNVTYSAMASDNCAVQTNFCLPASGSKFNLGTNTVTCKAVDSSGNTNTCAFTVTVVDHQAPTITCHANISTNTAPGACNSTNIIYSPTVSDNCAVRTNFCNPPSGTKFDLGTNTVTCTAVDSSANTNTCSFTVTVVNTTPPALTCPSNITVTATSSEGAAVEFQTNGIASATCTNVATVACNRTSGETFGVGTNTVTCTATDIRGNSNSCTFIILVNRAPVAVCSNITVSAGTNCTAAASIDGGSSDPDGDEIIRAQEPASPYGLGTNTVVLTVTDSHGASSSCTGTVIVVDTTLPSITCPEDFTINGTSAEGGIVEYESPQASDNCSEPIVACSPASGAMFPAGTNIVACTATDASRNSNSCSFAVFVNRPPVAVCSNVTVLADTNCTADASIDAGSSDPESDDITLVQEPAAPYELGDTTVVLTVTDVHGASSSCTGTVTVIALRIECPADILTNTAPGQCTATEIQLDTPTVTNNCSSLAGITNNAPDAFPIGTNTVTWTAVDEAGHSNTCRQLVIVRDTERPSITCSGNITTNATSSAGAIVEFTTNANDNCTNVTMTCTRQSGSTFAVGTQNVTCTATDAAGNTNSCTFVIHVKGPTEISADLADIVQGLGVDVNVVKPLSKQVLKIRQKIATGKTKTACQRLKQFIRKIEKLHSKGKISGADTTTLNTSAMSAQDALECTIR